MMLKVCRGSRRHSGTFGGGGGAVGLKGVLRVEMTKKYSVCQLGNLAQRTVFILPSILLQAFSDQTITF